MRYRKPHKDWSRCSECGQFTNTTKDGCHNCGDVEQQPAGDWVSDYFK